MITKCDLCGKKTTQINTPNSMFDGVKNFKGMCNDCMESLNDDYRVAQKASQKLIREAMTAAAEKIRSENTS